MFSKNDKRDNGKADARIAPSIISANLHVIGNLKSDGEVQVDGIVQGDVTGLALAIGERARVTGELTAEEVVVRGTVEGRIKAKHVRLTKTARVIGDIWQEILSIESGAHIEGHIKRLENDSTRKIQMNGEAIDKPIARVVTAIEHPATAQVIPAQKSGTR